MRAQIGLLYRGVIGFIKVVFEHVPSIPAGVPREVIGHSVEGKEIECFKVGNGPRRIVIASAIHGNEVGTAKLARHILTWLHENQKELPNLTCYVVPVLNPDGYARAQKHPQYLKGGTIGRVNAHDVDLNRNFDTPSFQKESVWAYGKDYASTRKMFCGEHAGSEPEVQALVQLIKKCDASVLWMFHNAGRDVIGNNDTLSQKEIALFSQKTGFRVLGPEDWKRLNQTGTAAEWCDVERITYIEVEGSSRWDSDWTVQKGAIQAVFADLNTTLSSR